MTTRPPQSKEEHDAMMRVLCACVDVTARLLQDCSLLGYTYDDTGRLVTRAVAERLHREAIEIRDRSLLRSRAA